MGLVSSPMPHHGPVTPLYSFAQFGYPSLPQDLSIPAQSLPQVTTAGGGSLSKSKSWPTPVSAATTGVSAQPGPGQLPETSSHSLSAPPSYSSVVSALIAPMPHYPLLAGNFYPQLPALTEAEQVMTTTAFPIKAQMIKDVFFTDAVAGDPLVTHLAHFEDEGEAIPLKSVFEVSRLSPPSSPSRLDHEDNSSLFGYDMDTVCSTPPLEGDGELLAESKFGQLEDGTEDHLRMITPPPHEYHSPQGEVPSRPDSAHSANSLPVVTSSSTQMGLYFLAQPQDMAMLVPSSAKYQSATSFSAPSYFGSAVTPSPVQTVSPRMLIHPNVLPNNPLASSNKKFGMAGRHGGPMSHSPTDDTSDESSNSYDEESDDDDYDAREYLPRPPTIMRGRPQLALKKSRSTPLAGTKRRRVVLDSEDEEVIVTKRSSTPAPPTTTTCRLVTPEPQPTTCGCAPENKGREVVQARPTQHPTLYETLTQTSIDWCRYCGTTEGINWRPGPWGKRTLCNKHGCDYKGYGFACKLPRLDLKAYVSESIEERDRPVLQLFCTACHDSRSYAGNVMVRCEGCPKAYHQQCFPGGIPDSLVQSNGTWYCDANCPANCRSKRVVVELPRKRLPLMCTPRAGGSAAIGTNATAVGGFVSPVTPNNEMERSTSRRISSPQPMSTVNGQSIPSTSINGSGAGVRVVNHRSNRRSRRVSSGFNANKSDIQLPPSPSPSVGEGDAPSPELSAEPSMATNLASPTNRGRTVGTKKRKQQHQQQQTLPTIAESGRA
ncbi:hypothetical protein IWQ61_001529 [Dispira simplex]|nr:hypothetical protein IWQ61_001529 [Dispira simplex]